MTRKMKVMVSVIIALAIMITGTAATVMAEDEPAPEVSATEAVNSDVIIEYIKMAVEEGILTSEEAEEITAWWEDRPESLDKLFDSCGVLHLVRNRNLRICDCKTKPAVSANSSNMGWFKVRIKHKLRNADETSTTNRLQKNARIQSQSISVEKIMPYNTRSVAITQQ